MAKLVSRTFNAETWPYPDRACRGGSEDMDDAYGQVPIAPSNVPLCIEAVYNQEADSVKYFVIYGQPFGTETAVPNC